ncbi:MAG: hypothetical protein AB1760_00300 [Pseudomonadota bacterium]
MSNYTHHEGVSLTSADGLAYGAKGSESKLIDGSTGAATFPSTLTVGGNLIPNTFTVSTTLDGANAATAANYGVFFIAPFACTVVSVREAHTAAGTDAGAVTLDIEKLTGTQAPDAGVAVLGATKIDLKGAANTVQSPALTATAADKTLAAGDRLCLKDTGVLTAVAGVAVTVELKGA